MGMQRMKMRTDIRQRPRQAPERAAAAAQQARPGGSAGPGYPSGDTAHGGGPKAGIQRQRLRDLLSRKFYLILVLAAVLAVGSFASPFFLTARNINSGLITNSSVVVLAIGQFAVIVTGGIDLSVGSVAALASVAGALMLAHHLPAGLVIVACLAMGAAIGAVNGLVIVFGKITPFIATLGMLNIVSGLAYLLQTGDLIQITDNRYISLLTGKTFVVAAPIVIAVVVLLIATTVMSGMPFGRRLYALGGNPEAARLSGLPVKADLIKAYSISGLLAALAGVMISAQLAEGSAIIGSNYELAAIAAAVVGGASLFGGRGDPLGAAIGALVIGAITDIMQLRNVASQSQLLIQGVVILVAVFFVTGAGGQLSAAIRGRVRDAVQRHPAEARGEAS
jgi:ribose transport system permease protein